MVAGDRPSDLGGPLRGIDLGGLVDTGIGGQQMVVRILDVVHEPTQFAVVPDIARPCRVPPVPFLSPVKRVLRWSRYWHAGSGHWCS